MKPFWFPIEPAAFLSDSLVDQMTTLELGACFRLLCRQWIDGDLPDDKEQLRRLARLSKPEMDDAWEVIQRFFPEVGKGKRANRYANEKRKEVQETLTKRHEAGVLGAERRWQNNGIPIAQPSENAKNGWQTHSKGNAIDIDIVKVKQNIKEKNNKKKSDDILDLINRTIS
jgi:uncharacterized protein YdaU (DUF1376 family)